MSLAHSRLSLELKGTFYNVNLSYPCLQCQKIFNIPLFTPPKLVAYSEAPYRPTLFLLHVCKKGTHETYNG